MLKNKVSIRENYQVLDRAMQKFRHHMGCPDENLLCGFIDGTLRKNNLQTWQKVLSHTKRCQTCQDDVSEITEMVDCFNIQTRDKQVGHEIISMEQMYLDNVANCIAKEQIIKTNYFKRISEIKNRYNDLSSNIFAKTTVGNYHLVCTNEEIWMEHFVSSYLTLANAQSSTNSGQEQYVFSNLAEFYERQVYIGEAVHWRLYNYEVINRKYTYCDYDRYSLADDPC